MIQDIVYKILPNVAESKSFSSIDLFIDLCSVVNVILDFQTAHLSISRWMLVSHR